MALVSCPECKQTVSDQAVSCPHCGYIINRNNDPVVRDLRMQRSIRLVWALVVIFLAIVVFIILAVASATR